MEVRNFEPEDAEELSQLIVQNLQQVLIKDYSNEAIEALMPFFTPEKLIEDSKQQFMLVGLLDDELVGIAALDDDRVRNVFVDVARHRRGIGRKLMTVIEAFAQAQHLKKIYLMAALSACGFYEKLGYKIVKRFEHDLNGIAIPEIQMEKALVLD
ncbi:MAG: GNAT family N-acetyltransferase [Anaerolineae bacterium]|nr:GNAT family N-acetyltransferase [Anaerolineae bacterium]